MSIKPRRGSPAISSRQKARFIEHLSQTSNVSAAAAVAGFDRATPYRLRQADPEFATAWEDALTEATDTLEAEARRRAVEGVREPVVSMGRLVTLDGEPLYIRRYSDNLLIALLKAHRPAKFNPPPAAASQAPIPPELQPDPLPTPDEPAPDKIIQ